MKSGEKKKECALIMRTALGLRSTAEGIQVEEEEEESKRFSKVLSQ